MYPWKKFKIIAEGEHATNFHGQSTKFNIEKNSKALILMKSQKSSFLISPKLNRMNNNLILPKICFAVVFKSSSCSYSHVSFKFLFPQNNARVNIKSRKKYNERRQKLRWATICLFMYNGTTKRRWVAHFAFQIMFAKLLPPKITWLNWQLIPFSLFLSSSF